MGKTGPQTGHFPEVLHFKEKKIMSFTKKYRFNSWEDLFDYWSKESVFFEKINKIRHEYKEKRKKLLDNFDKKVKEYQKEEKKEITPEVFKNLYKEHAAEKMRKLNQQENQKINNLH
jgi:hypothetical protein